jgi:hypothetical protein
MSGGIFIEECVVMFKDGKEGDQSVILSLIFDLDGVQRGKLYPMRNGIHIDLEAVEVH